MNPIPEAETMKRLLSYCVTAVFLASIASHTAHAQVGSTTDIIMGQVVSPEGQAISGARVEVTSAETQIKRTKTTGADGRYTIVFPDGGGSYTVQVMAIGYSPTRTTAIPSPSCSGAGKSSVRSS